MILIPLYQPYFGFNSLYNERPCVCVVLLSITAGNPPCFGGERTEPATNDSEYFIGVGGGGVVHRIGRMAALLPPDLLARKARVDAAQLQRLRKDGASGNLR